MAQRTYDSTVARIAGNIMSGASALWVNGVSDGAVQRAVEAARAIVEETQRTDAAAADLLSALKKLREWHKGEYHSNPDIDAQADAAIAKAEGR